MGKCEQAEFTQGNPVLEILPIVNRFSELHDSFFLLKHIKGLRKTYPRKGKNISKKRQKKGGGYPADG